MEPWRILTVSSVHYTLAQNLVLFTDDLFCTLFYESLYIGRNRKYPSKNLNVLLHFFFRISMKSRDEIFLFFLKHFAYLKIKLKKKPILHWENLYLFIHPKISNRSLINYCIGFIIVNCRYLRDQRIQIFLLWNRIDNYVYWITDFHILKLK